MLYPNLRKHVCRWLVFKTTQLHLVCFNSRSKQPLIIDVLDQFATWCVKANEQLGELTRSPPKTFPIYFAPKIRLREALTLAAKQSYTDRDHDPQIRAQEDRTYTSGELELEGGTQASGSDLL